ncbi:aldehyde dehydrogenase [Rhodobacteraceae bacterium CH30]|nr:aldehyde dehydrogenase [Rhodobacteraceae bacterium CH30]
MTEAECKLSELSGKHYLDGAYCLGQGVRHDVIDPATEMVIGQYAQATPGEISHAVAVANRAARAWWALSAPERTQALHEVARKLIAGAARLGEALTREMGKPYRESHWEAGAGASAFAYYAELARHDSGRVAAPAVVGQLQMVLKEPLGVVVSIVPYNFPCLLFAWQAAAALAAGNAVIVKPSELTSLSLLLMLEAFDHLPAGLVQLVCGDAEVGRQLVADRDTHAVAFTGSVPAAQAVARSAAERFKPVLIEASGNDPLIVMPSADIRVAARAAAFAAFLNCGQVCTSAERLYVHEAVYDEFVEALVYEARQLRVGHGLGKVDLGPMVSRRERDRVESVVAHALEQGARLRCGGHRPPRLERGWFYLPTVLEVTHEMDIMHAEIFGPLAPVCKVASLDEAIRLANDSEFGLGANIFTRDLSEAMRAIGEIESGIVWVNTPLNDNDAIPFGGRKLTGSGRELGGEGLEQFRQSKMVMISPDLADDPEWFPYPDQDAFPS